MVIINPIEDGDLVLFPPNLGSCSNVFNLKDGLDEGRDKGIKHFKHEHGLEFKEDLRNVQCRGCGHDMGGRGFSCMKKHCDFHLHEICAVFPKKITNYPHHSEHPLELVESFWITCHVCNRCSYTNFYYHCHICNFYVDLTCAAMFFLLCGGPHDHELTANLYPASFLCSCCGEKHGKLGISYECKTCTFWIHEQCYYLPDTIQHDCHKHLLHMTPSHPFRHDHCGVCEKRLPNYFYKIYYCERCWYGIHISCWNKKRIIEPIEIPPENDELIEFPMPFAHSVQNILTHFIKQKCGWKDIKDEKEQQVLLHHSSHEHPLTLIDGPIENGSDVEFDLPEFNNLNISDRLVHQSCNACTLLVLDASFYRCNESCNFILHEWCAKLPREIQHPAHSDTEHTLVLHEKVELFDFFYCHGCSELGNGFAYKCTMCKDYYLDVRCASLPKFIKHENDEHPLLLRDDIIGGRCNSCATFWGATFQGGTFLFSCDACHFRLDIGCLLLPKEIKHRYDNHGFKLTNLAPTCNEYYCEFCEMELDPNTWSYHCFECDRFVDIRCVRSRVFNLFRSPLKFGLSYRHNILMSPWTCIPVFRKDISYCCKCFHDVFILYGTALFCRELDKILCPDCYIGNVTYGMSKPKYVSSHQGEIESPASWVVK